MCKCSEFPAAVIVFVRSTCLSQVYGDRNKRPPKRQFILWPALQSSASLQSQENWFVWSDSFWASRDRPSPEQECPWTSSPSWFRPGSCGQGQRSRLIWLPLEQASLSASCWDPGPLLPSPTAHSLLGAVGVLCTGYCPCRHVRQCDDRDLLWEALTSSPCYAHRAGFGH